MSDNILVNGNAYSWGSIVFKIGSERYTNLTSIAYGDKRTRVKGYGMNRHQGPTRRSRGKYETDPVKLGGAKSTIQQIRADLAGKASDGISYGDVSGDITVAYTETDETPIFVEIIDCVITENATSEEENADPLKEEITLDCMYIKRNGLVLFDASQGYPGGGRLTGAL